MATGIYSQNILSTTSDRDIVNLFTGIITSPEDIPDQEDGTAYEDLFQKARHLITGLEYDLNDSTISHIKNNNLIDASSSSGYESDLLNSSTSFSDDLTK